MNEKENTIDTHLISYVGGIGADMVKTEIEISADCQVTVALEYSGATFSSLKRIYLGETSPSASPSSSPATTPTKRIRTTGESQSPQSLAFYAFGLAKKLNFDAVNEVIHIDKCETAALSNGIKKERNDLMADDGTVLRSCVNTLIKVSQSDQLFADKAGKAHGVVKRCFLLTLDMVYNEASDKVKFLPLLEIIASTKLMKKYNLGSPYVENVETRARQLIGMLGLTIQGRRSFFNEEVAFNEVSILSEDEDLEDHNNRVKARIEALEEIIRVSYQIYQCGLAKTEYEQEQLFLIFDRALTAFLEIGWFKVETRDFEILAAKSKRIRRTLRSINTTPDDALKLKDELQEIREELELHLHFSPDSFIAYVSGIETIANIATNGFFMCSPKLEKISKLLSNLYILYYTGDILEDCDPSDSFSTIVSLNECNKAFGSPVGAPDSFIFPDNFETGLEIGNACANIFLLTKALTRYIISSNQKLEEVSKKTPCSFKTSIFKVFK